MALRGGKKHADTWRRKGTAEYSKFITKNKRGPTTSAEEDREDVGNHQSPPSQLHEGRGTWKERGKKKGEESTSAGSAWKKRQSSIGGRRTPLPEKERTHPLNVPPVRLLERIVTLHLWGEREWKRTSDCSSVRDGDKKRGGAPPSTGSDKLYRIREGGVCPFNGKKSESAKQKTETCAFFNVSVDFSFENPRPKEENRTSRRKGGTTPSL